MKVCIYTCECMHRDDHLQACAHILTDMHAYTTKSTKHTKHKQHQHTHEQAQHTCKQRPCIHAHALALFMVHEVHVRAGI